MATMMIKLDMLVEGLVPKVATAESSHCLTGREEPAFLHIGHSP